MAVSAAVTGMPKQVGEIVAALADQFEVALGSPAVVGTLCSELRDFLHNPPGEADFVVLKHLTSCLNKRDGEIAQPLFDLIVDAANRCAVPGSLLVALIKVRDPELANHALQQILNAAEAGKLVIGRYIIETIAEQREMALSPLRDAAAMTSIAKIVERADGLAAETRAVEHLYLRDAHPAVRRLAAHVLDGEQATVADHVAGKLFSAEDYEFLRPYFAFTRISHVDMMSVAEAARNSPAMITALRSAENTCGSAVLRDIISELGWSHVNSGMSVERRAGVSVAGSLPLMLSEHDASLLESCGDARRLSKAVVVVATSGAAEEPPAMSAGSERVNRYRAYNLAHAELLDLILRIEPLSRERALDILARMDRVVDDFVTLFSSHSDECAILPDVYNRLKQKILTELADGDKRPQLSPELTRLVQMFEEPQSVGKVRTLHGLKRYLHQQGLRLGFRLLEMGCSPSRSVDVLVLLDGQWLRAKPIRFVDFGTDTQKGAVTGALPYPVQIVVDGFARQLLHGHTSFPAVDIFCYGNEVHYYLSYRAHPAFLRIDYSPPLRGGMIDLEYFGVSNSELDIHPNLNLDAIQTFLRVLDFDVQLNCTRIHARCDKERVLDLGTLCDRAEMLFCLVPHLMDVDWAIGSLKVSLDAKRQIADAWAESFALWGVLPVKQLLTTDRSGILMERVSGAAGVRDVAWSGHGSYRDIFSAPPPDGFLDQLSGAFETLELEALSLHDEDARRPMGQRRLEHRLLRSLWSAARRGEVVASDEGYRRSPPEQFQRVHEAVGFADIIAAGPNMMAHAIALARVLAPLERMLAFATTGKIQGFTVQRTALPLTRERIGVFVLRDRSDILRMAYFARDDVLYRRRSDVTQPWQFNGSCDLDEFVNLLRKNNYIIMYAEMPAERAQAEAAHLQEDLLQTPVPIHLRPLSGERSIEGMRASPGRAVGRAVFGTAGRSPTDLKGTILFCETIRLDDNAYLFHCSGVVTTGGGVLSHAGLMAVQFGKPAMIIPARWKRREDGKACVRFLIEEFQEQEQVLHGMQLITRHSVYQRECEVVQGDVVVLNVSKGTLLVLGSDRDVIAIQEGMRQLKEANARLWKATTDAEKLAMRGRCIRARYQLEKVLGRLSDPVMGRYTIHELMEGWTDLPLQDSPSGREGFLSLLFRNPQVGDDARGYVEYLASELERRCTAAGRQVERFVPTSLSPYEILLWRLGWYRLMQSLESATALLESCGIARSGAVLPSPQHIDQIVCQRLEELRHTLVADLEKTDATRSSPARLRHHLRQLERLDSLLETADGSQGVAEALRARVAESDSDGLRRLQTSRIVTSAESGIEHAPLIGYKAANLAEIERLEGSGKVPPWYAITDTAFQEILHSPLAHLSATCSANLDDDATLGAALDGILMRADLTDAEKSRSIRSLWDGITLPAKIADEVVAAYHDLGETDHREPLVALRSSGREEDTETFARAGEFETFLFIRGDQPLLEHLKRTWSGLWTERAIHNRTHVARVREVPGGGVIVQRMIPARVSGVLLTANVATGDPREIVINVGLGLGEGIVSGTVAADYVIVTKEGDLAHEPLRFKYVTSDKRQQVVFNERTGAGTTLVETLYHQRLRPALEYVELLELVTTAVRLETAYGYPIDMEFAIEGTKLWVLQVRPVPAFVSVYRETMEHLPLCNNRIATPKEIRE